MEVHPIACRQLCENTFCISASAINVATHDSRAVALGDAGSVVAGTIIVDPYFIEWLGLLRHGLEQAREIARCIIGGD